MRLLTYVCCVLTVLVYGFNIHAFVVAMLVSALVIMSFIDMKKFEIPNGINIFILILGIINLFIEKTYLEKIIGFFTVSIVLFLIYMLTKGKGMGGGDVKLMAVCGFFLGWKKIVFAFIMGCVCAVAVHSFKMRFLGKGSKLAFGPYLAIGIIITVWFGEKILCCT